MGGSQAKDQISQINTHTHTLALLRRKCSFSIRQAYVNQDFPYLQRVPLHHLHSFTEHVLSTYCMMSTVPDTEIMRQRASSCPCSVGKQTYKKSFTKECDKNRERNTKDILAALTHDPRVASRILRAWPEESLVLLECHGK